MKVVPCFGGLSLTDGPSRALARMDAAATRWPHRRFAVGRAGRTWFAYLRPLNEDETSPTDPLSAAPALPCGRWLSLDSSAFSPRFRFDDQTQRVQLQAGLAGLFYARTSTDLVFATDPTVLAAASDDPPKLDEVSVASLLLLDHVPWSRSLFHDIRQLGPFEEITASEQGWSQSVSHTEDWLRDRPPPGTTTLTDVVNAFSRSVERCARANGSVTIPLSGGVDSRAILAATPNRGCRSAYTLGPEVSSEGRIAGQVAQLTGVDHDYFPYPEDYLSCYLARIVHITGGVVSALHGHAIYPLQDPLVRRWGRVLPGTNGEYGRGYWKASLFEGCQSPADHWSRLLRKNTKTSASLVAGLFCEAQRSELPSRWEALAQEFARDLPCSFESLVADLDEIYLLRRVARFMVWGPYIWSTAIDVGMPFLDIDYVRTVAGLPVELRCGPAIARATIQKHAPRLLEIPLYPSGRRLDTGRATLRLRISRKLRQWLRCREVKTHSYATWIRHERAFVDRLLQDSLAGACGYLDPEAVKQLWHDHLHGANHSRLLLNVLTIELALRIVQGVETVRWTPD